MQPRPPWKLPPRAMVGIESCGMLLSAVHKEEGEETLRRTETGETLYE